MHYKVNLKCHKLQYKISTKSHCTSNTQMVKERNEAVAKLTHEMKETERLEAERKGLFARIEALERGNNGTSSSVNPTGPMDVNKTMADANMKLKLEVGF